MFPGIQGILIAAALSALLAGAGAWKVTHTYDSAKYVTLQRDYATAQTRAIAAVQARDKAALAVNDAAVAENATVQNTITTHTVTLIQQVPHYVHETSVSNCVPFGIVRVLDAQIYGVTPDQLPLPAGSTDDSCSPLGWPAVASALVADLGTCKQNAEQLNLLGAASINLSKIKP